MEGRLGAEHRRAGRRWLALASLSSGLAGCLVSFKDYPLGDTTGGGSPPGAGAAGSSGSGGGDGGNGGAGTAGGSTASGGSAPAGSGGGAAGDAPCVQQ